MEKNNYNTGAEEDIYVDPASRHVSVGEYARTRITSLKPPMNKVANPFKALRLLNRAQWLNFLVGFLGWTWDAVDFFTVSLTVSNLADTFKVSTTDIT